MAHNQRPSLDGLTSTSSDDNPNGPSNTHDTEPSLPRIGSAPPSPTSSLPASAAAQHLLLSPDGSDQVHVLVNVNHPHLSGGEEDGHNDTASDPDYGTDEEPDTDIESAAHGSGDPRQGMLVPDLQRAWDDSDEDEPQVLAVEHELDEAGPSRARAGLREHRARRNGSQDLMPLPIPFALSSRQRRSCWRFLTSPPTQNSLSAPAVTLNLFAGSLHPAVLLSMPYYFERTGLVLGLVGLLGVGFLSGVGGGLWIVLARYVGRGDDEEDPEDTTRRAATGPDHTGSSSRKRAKKLASYGEGGNMTTLEGVTGAALGRHTVWKRTLGRTISGALLAAYATGTAFLAYFALVDLLLQVLLHYSPRGVPTHDRLFVTAVVGGLLTAPLVIFPLAKRTLIRFSTACAVTLYPVLLTVLLVKIYTMDPDTAMPRPIDISGPNAQPLRPPSIWAPYSLLPVLTLSSSPLQIIQHNRSLRRIGVSRSNTKAFMAAQVGQVLLVAGIGVAFGIGVGTQGMGQRLGIELTHPNLMASLPTNDHLFNTARVCFVLLLATHYALCLVTARSSWGRLLRLYHLNPFRYRRGLRGNQPQQVEGGDADGNGNRNGHGDGEANGNRNARRASLGGGGRVAQGSRGKASARSQGSTPRLPTSGSSNSFSQPGSFPAPKRKLPRQWNRLSRNALGGLILWCFCAGTAYLSGVGGLRRSKNEKAGEEARFVRSAEIVGLLGAAVGFILPGLVWVVLFHVRRPRAILLAGTLGQQVAAVAQELGSRAGIWLRGLSAARRERLARERRRRMLGADADADATEVTVPSPGYFDRVGGSSSLLFSTVRRAVGAGGRNEAGRGAEAEERQGLLTDDGRARDDDADADDERERGEQGTQPAVPSPRDGIAMPRSFSPRGQAVDLLGPHSSSAQARPRSGSPDPVAVLLAQKERQLQRRRRGRRLYQDLLVCAAVLPFGMALVVLGAMELSRGGY